MLEILAANPDEKFTFEEKDAKTLVSELDLTHAFSSPHPEQGQQHTFHYGNFSHFILVILHLGSADSKENGFKVLCFPRSKVSYQQFTDAAARALNPNLAR